MTSLSHLPKDKDGVGEAELRKDELLMMREVLPIMAQNLTPVDIVAGKTAANEYIKRRLAELNQVIEELKND